MKKDCSRTEVFLSEWARMCTSYPSSCINCPMLDSDNGICNISRIYWNDTNISATKDIVQKWSDEHTEQSIKEKFFEVFPNAPTKFDGYPYGCCVDLGLKTGDCSGINCKDCWDRKYKEVEEC